MRKNRKKYKTMRKRKELISAISTYLFLVVLFVVVLFFTCMFFISRILIKGDNISSINGYSAQTIISGSMVPTLDVYDVIIVKREATYQVGDIISFYIQNEAGEPVLYTHRIVSMGNGYYITKGDANNTWDDWEVPIQNVVGTIQFRIPKVGKIVLKMSTISIEAYKRLIVIVYAILIGLIIFNTIKEAMKKFTPQEIRLLELKECKKLNHKTRRKILWLKFKRWLQNKLRKL